MSYSTRSGRSTRADMPYHSRMQLRATELSARNIDYAEANAAAPQQFHSRSVATAC